MIIASMEFALPADVVIGDMIMGCWKDGQWALLPASIRVEEITRANYVQRTNVYTFDGRRYGVDGTSLGGGVAMSFTERSHLLIKERVQS